MIRAHGPFQYMRDFKAFALDYEYYLTLSDKPLQVCLSERQMYILSVQNSYTPWLTRWYNKNAATAAGLSAIAAEIEAILMCGCAGSETPSFTDRINSQTYITNTATTYETVYNTWNDAGQTVASIAPDLDYSGGTPADIDKLLCLALEMLLIAIVESAKANKDGTEAQNRDMVKNLGNVLGALGVAGGAATAAGGAAAAFVGFLGGPYLILGLALSAVGLAIANLIWTTDLSVFNDQGAIDDVKCTLVNNIVGNTPTQAVFQAGLTPNAFAPGSNAEKLAAIVQPFLDDLDTYLQWLSTAQGLYEVSNFGVLPECGCGDGENCFYPNNWVPYHLGTLISQTDTYMEIQAIPDGGGGYFIETGDTSRTNFCMYNGYTVVSGAWTPAGAYPEGWVAWSTGGTNITDRDATGYQVCLISLASSTPCTVRFLIS